MIPIKVIDNQIPIIIPPPYNLTIYIIAIKCDKAMTNKKAPLQIIIVMVLFMSYPANGIACVYDTACYGPNG